MAERRVRYRFERTGEYLTLPPALSPFFTTSTMSSTACRFDLVGGTCVSGSCGCVSVGNGAFATSLRDFIIARSSMGTRCKNIWVMCSRDELYSHLQTANVLRRSWRINRPPLVHVCISLAPFVSCKLKLKYVRAHTESASDSFSSSFSSCSLAVASSSAARALALALVCENR